MARSLRCKDPVAWNRPTERSEATGSSVTSARSDDPVPQFWRKPPSKQPRSPCGAPLLQIGETHRLNIGPFGLGHRLVVREISEAPQHIVGILGIHPIENIAGASSEFSIDAATGHAGDHNSAAARTHRCSRASERRSIKFVVNLRRTTKRPADTGRVVAFAIGRMGPRGCGYGFRLAARASRFSAGVARPTRLRRVASRISRSSSSAMRNVIAERGPKSDRSAALISTPAFAIRRPMSSVITAAAIARRLCAALSVSAYRPTRER